MTDVPVLDALYVHLHVVVGRLPLLLLSALEPLEDQSAEHDVGDHQAARADRREEERDEPAAVRAAQLSRAPARRRRLRLRLLARPPRQRRIHFRRLSLIHI